MTKFKEKNLKDALRVIEKISMINNENEENKVLLDIYKIAHSSIGDCGNPHTDWQEEKNKIILSLENY